MKSDYRARAIRFLRSIYPYIAGDLTNAFDVEQAVRRYNFDHSRKVEFHNGSARIALITSDYVVKWDYDEDNVKDIGGCEKEWEMYCFAQKHSMEYLLAECTLFEYEGIVFEIMPRIRAIGRQHHKADLGYMLSDAEMEWLRKVGILYDLHDWNWGIKNNKPVIIDYAYIEYE